MIKKVKSLVLLTLFLFISNFSLSAESKKNPPFEENKHIMSITAITDVFGDGQKTTAVAVEYDKSINSSKLSKSSFIVENRTISKVYANTKPEKSSRGSDGKYVIIELSPNDENAYTFTTVRNSSTPFIKKETKVSLAQQKDITTVSGDKYPGNSRFMPNNKEINPIVDDFLKFEFQDPKTGKILKYNLFIPKNYDKNKSYPLVTFIHDAGTVGTDTDITLIQGLGAVIWASTEEQAKHEAFVLAPQYSNVIVNDNFEITDDGDTTIDLINFITNQYSIDKNRLYITGQSMGCMSSIALNIKYPDMFTALFLVAGQWDPEPMKVLSHKNIWIVVSEGDQKAFPGMNASLAEMKTAGAKINTAFWNGRAGKSEMDENVKKMIEENTNIKYTVLKTGTVIPQDQDQNAGNYHRYTWQIAYTIEGIRDWLFTQIKK
jgi:predicted peptidase